MPFRPEDLHDLDVAQEIRIETDTDKKSIRSTVIWIVVDRGEVFVRSVRGETGRWYREALQNPNVTLNDAGRRLPVTAIAVRDADSIQRINDGLKRKYVGQDGYDDMFTPNVLNANFRLEPRFADEQPLEAPDLLDVEESELGPPVAVSMLDAGPELEENIILQPHKSA
jgi:hypothetical protein